MKNLQKFINKLEKKGLETYLKASSPLDNEDITIITGYVTNREMTHEIIVKIENDDVKIFVETSFNLDSIKESVKQIVKIFNDTYKAYHNEIF